MRNTRSEDFKIRKDRILSITVDEYIKSVSPVSSNYIAQGYPQPISSATVRNILAELEDDGFLTHPHTSAGRIPTQKGYRYYVDYLMNEIQLLENEKLRIKEECAQDTKELELLLEKTSHVLSQETHYTSIVSVDGWGNKIFCQGTSHIVEYPEYQDLRKIANILNAIDEKEALLDIINQSLQDRINIYIGGELTCSEIDSCSLVVSGYKTKNGSTGRMAVLGPTRMDYSRVVSTLEYVSALMEDILY